MPGPTRRRHRALLKTDAMETLADQDPHMRRQQPRGRPNISLIARQLGLNPSYVHKVGRGKLPPLELAFQAAADAGDWAVIGQVLEVRDEHGNVVCMRTTHRACPAASGARGPA